MRISFRKTEIGPLTAILGGGLTAALLDITYAFVFFGLRGANPVRILQTIASGVLGKAAYQGGAGAAVLGAVLHAGIAVVMAAVYVSASRVLPALNRRPWLWGPLYGIGCYLVMNYVVLLLRFGPRPAPHLEVLVGGVAIHMFGVGLPIALFAARAALSSRLPGSTSTPQPAA
ncbi:hypothetical protein ASD38_19890 [Caulobacter sp. Root487D2Y]|jgi:hypothetical protein|uniref:hypothetical protein n=1 Tax=Caulobacter sp. Root487D2Y TaxID=1736547 RepID=UPI0006F57A97|nr:hypothetical protein [Caulobacter sp. Root487D2Y]KQY26503.1 hypothetical protein ASD38_19890 [Caulobacter sp. Root487D2Y]